MTNNLEESRGAFCPVPKYETGRSTPADSKSQPPRCESFFTISMPAYFFGVAAVAAGGLTAGAFCGGDAVAGLAAGAELLLDTCMAS